MSARANGLEPTVEDLEALLPWSVKAEHLAGLQWLLGKIEAARAGLPS